MMGTPQLAMGTLFANRFEIERAAGSGGMGTVYRARDRYSGDVVALKLLHGSPKGPQEAERFTREAQLLSELRHPGIVSYVSHGQTPEGQRFLAMEWLDGQDLGERLSQGPLSVRDCLRLIEQIAEPLSVAHQRGIIHRDLKPTNLFLLNGDISRVKILDFGIARRLSVSRALTRSGVVIGTPEYMAPEQARGTRQLTPAVDLFSLGCILYECLTGAPPFVADHIAAVLVRILFEEPAPVEQRRSGIPEAVSTLLSRLLEKDPERRLGDAALVIRAVAAIGGLPDQLLQTTLPAPVKTTPAPGDSEQVLLSLVLAISPHALKRGSSMLLSAEVIAEITRHERLLAKARELGAQADLLLNGAMVITVPQLPSAQDQAVQAVRLASLVKEHWPEAQVVVVTGKGSRSRGGLTGEVLDRAWRLLGNQPGTPPLTPEPAVPIRLDHVSAGLLQTRFELSPMLTKEEGYTLGSELLAADAGRQLLGKPTPCVGRDRELAALEALYSECKEELSAQAVLVLGPPGLGKSRLRHEFVRRLEGRGEHALILTARGDPMKVKSIYGILGEALRRWLDLRERQDPAEQRAQIRQRISLALPGSDALRVTLFLSEICGAPFPDGESPLLGAARQDPRIMSDQVERAWLDSLQLMCTDSPLLLILEDLHWSDALTIKLVGAALRRLRDHAFMVLALARSEVYDLYPNLWAGAVQLLQLHPLPRKASERLVRQILGQDISSAQMAQLIEQSAGNPLFLEELIRAAAEGKTGALPETVIAMLQARIGRLPAIARRELRAASVFGETFWENGVFSLLAATHGNEQLPETLEDLVREEIIEKIPKGRFASETQYQFRHALVRDAIYELASPEEKVAWHAAAGKFLEGIGEREAILLADHYYLGSEPLRAIKCYARAAEQAYDASNMDAALACIERGLGCGAIKEERGELLSLHCLIKAFREEQQQILTIGREALSLLRTGSKPACQVLFPLALATLFTEPDRLPELMGLLLSVEPEPEAIPIYCNALTFLATLFISIGQKGSTDSLRHRAHQIRQRLADHDHNAWGWYWFMEAFHSQSTVHLPYTCAENLSKSAQAAHEAGNRQLQCLAMSFRGKAVAQLGDRASALPILRANLRIAEQVKDELVLNNARSDLAHLLAEAGPPSPAACKEATQLVQAANQSKNPLVRAAAHEVLTLVAQARGDLGTAETEARAAYQLQGMFPPFKASSAAQLSSILRQLGKDAESLQVCADALQEQTTLAIEPYALVALYLELAEARERVGQHELAHDAIVHALPILQRQMDDIPNAEVRATYLREIPENVRLLELARQWAIDTSSLNLGA